MEESASMETIPWRIQGPIAVIAVAAVVVIIAVVPTISDQSDKRGRARARTASAGVFVTVAEDARKAGDLDMAGQAYASALEKDPLNADYALALAEIHAEQILKRPGVLNGNNALRLQLEISARIVDGKQAKPRLLTAYARVLMFRGKHAASRERLRDAIKADPDLAVAHLFLGEALLRAKEPAQAQQSLEKSLSLEPGRPLAHWALGRAFAVRRSLRRGGLCRTTSCWWGRR